VLDTQSKLIFTITTQSGAIRRPEYSFCSSTSLLEFLESLLWIRCCWVVPRWNGSLARVGSPRDVRLHNSPRAWIKRPVKSPSWDRLRSPETFTSQEHPCHRHFIQTVTASHCRTNSTSRKIPTALADHVEKNKLEGQLKYNLFVGASSGAETENRWARLNMIERRSPHQVGKEIAKGINNGNIKFFDKHLSMFPVDLMYG
jgi:hypothetical protein